MKTIRILSVIGLAAYLILQGLFFLALIHSPAILAVTGIIGLATGVLMFISLIHWIRYKKGN